MPPALAAVCQSPFRPFGLAGVTYGLALVALWTVVQAGAAQPLAALAAARWHGHEMLFGFAGAIACAIALTALPGWAGTPEVRGHALLALAATWLVARAAFWLQPLLPLPVALVLACAPWVAIAALLVVHVARAADRRLLLVPAIFAALAVAAGLATAGHGRAGFALAVYALMALFGLAAGVFTPVFTRTYLRQRRLGDVPPARAWLDRAAFAAIVALAALDLADAPAAVRAFAALVAAIVHGARLARWRGWRTGRDPLLWTMHLGGAWFVLALALAALGETGVTGAQRAWLHAFTVGALGSMMIGLLTRVVLRHTGRPLVVAGGVVAAFALVQAAAVLRVAGALVDGGPAWIVAAGLAWCVAFAAYLRAYAAFLVTPSLPRMTGPLALDSQPRGEGAPAVPAHRPPRVP